jgi:hypothetical protein
VENWRGTTLSFILHYQEQIWLYDQLQPPNEQTSDHAKMIYLQNAVYAVEELRLVRTTGSQIALANGTVPTYKDYEALLKLAAPAHAPVKHQPTRSAECTDIWNANVTESFHEAYEFGFDIDTPTDIVQAHMRDQLGGRPGPNYPTTLGWTFFERYRQIAASIPKNLLACHHYVTNQGTTKHGYLRMLRSTGLYSSTLRTMMPLLHLLS